MAVDDSARNNLGQIEIDSRNMQHDLKHLKIAESAGCFRSMHYLITCFEQSLVSRESIDSTLAAYNRCCVERRSEARDTFISLHI